jgi:hypothetical protein
VGNHVRLFSDILSSSIWQEPVEIRIVWISLLAMADEQGYVGSSLVGVARAAGVSVETAKQALDRFCEPDTDSRSPENEGRRLSLADRGWQILNYSKFNEGPDERSIRAYERDRKRKSRNVRECPGMSGTEQISPSAQQRTDTTGTHEGQQTSPGMSRNVPDKCTITRDTLDSTRVPKNIGAPSDVPDTVWRDFLALRKAKRAPVTPTVVAGIQREAAKAGWTMERALTECVTRGWQSFKADWVQKEKSFSKTDYTNGLGTKRADGSYDL